MTVVHHEAHAAHRLGPLARMRERCRVGLRSAIGMASLPLGYAVEVEAIVEVD